MSYYPDLSEYVYGREPASKSRLNVGWLSAGHDFETGPAPNEFKVKLFALKLEPVALSWIYFNGDPPWHQCEFCGNGHWCWENKGVGEIRVTKDGITYCAPVLVLHYVMAHNYRPPQEFIEAVLDWKLPS